jgi:hypothetical protein
MQILTTKRKNLSKSKSKYIKLGIIYQTIFCLSSFSQQIVYLNKEALLLIMVVAVAIVSCKQTGAFSEKYNSH